MAGTHPKSQPNQYPHMSKYSPGKIPLQFALALLKLWPSYHLGLRKMVHANVFIRPAKLKDFDAHF